MNAFMGKTKFENVFLSLVNIYIYILIFKPKCDSVQEMANFLHIVTLKILKQTFLYFFLPQSLKC